MCPLSVVMPPVLPSVTVFRHKLGRTPKSVGQYLPSPGRSQDSESQPSRRMSHSWGKGRSLSRRLVQDLHRSTTGSGSGLAETQTISHYPHPLSHELRLSGRSAKFNLRAECICVGSFLQSLPRPVRQGRRILIRARSRRIEGRRATAPKGRHRAAHGHRPGIGAQHLRQSPEGAGQMRPCVRPPLQGSTRVRPSSLGVAQGWHSSPRWGLGPHIKVSLQSNEMRRPWPVRGIHVVDGREPC